MERWPDASLEATFGAGTATNLALSGDMTQNSIWRLSRIERTKYSPSLVILSIRTSNIGDNESPCAIAYGISHSTQRH